MTAQPLDPRQIVDPDATRTSTDDSGPDRMIGRYRLLQRLGEGGMGVVWLAE